MTSSEPQGMHVHPNAMSYNDVLIAEIPAAMRARLEADGRRHGLLLGLILLMLIVFADYFVLPSLLNEAGTIWTSLIRHALLLLAVPCILFLPSVMKRRNLRKELRFHSQHGKWRWDH